MTVRKITSLEQRALYERLCFAEGTVYNEHQADCEKNIKYYFGNQYSADELRSKSANGDYVIQINKIRKAINAMTGLLTANKPQFTCVSVGKEDSFKSEAYSKMLDNSWRVSNGLEKYRSAVKGGLRDNIGYLFVSPTVDGNVGFDNLSYSEVIVDPRSKNELFDDAEYIYIVRWISIENAMRKYNLPASAFTQSRPTEWKGSLLDSLGKKAKVGKLIDNTKTHVKIYEGFRKVAEPVYQNLINGQKALIGTKNRIQMQTIVGYWHVDEVMMPDVVTHYPIVPFFAEQVDNPYKIGEVPFLLEIQDYINSSFGILLKNASINSDPKVIMAEDAINGNMTDFAKNWSDGSSIKFVNTAEDLNAIKVINGQPINSAFMTLMQILGQEFEKLTMPSDQQGYKDSSMEARGALMERREAVMDSMKIVIGHCDSALNRLGTVTLQYSKAFITPERLGNICNLPELKKELSKLPQLDTENEEAVRAFTEQALQQGGNTFQIEKQISDITLLKEKIKAILECISGSFDEIDVAVTPKSYSPSYDMMQFNYLLMMRQSGITIPDDIILNHAPIEDSKEIAKTVSILNRATEQNAFLQDELEKVSAELDKTRLAMLQGKQETEILRLTSKYQKRVDDFNNKAYVQKKVGGLVERQNVNLAKKEIDHKVEMIISEAKHEAAMRLQEEDRDKGKPQIQSIKDYIREN